MAPHVSASFLQLLRPPPAMAIADRTTKPSSTTDRHFVTWTEEEDEILRQAVQQHGTEKWSLIAAQFQNKTGRQCRRRWLTYLSTACKKGGWSLEEDQMLLEAHRKYGNRWTEIAKVVPGRTDNAVKNRFCALCKKQAKDMDVSSSQSSGDASAEEDRVTQKKRVLGENKNILNKKSRNADLRQRQDNDLALRNRQHPVQLTKPLYAAPSVDQSLANRAHPVRYSPPFIQAGKSDKANAGRRGQQRTAVLMKDPDSRGFTASLLPKIAACEPASTQGIAAEGRMIAPVVCANPSARWAASLNQDAELIDSPIERRNTRLRYGDAPEDGWKAFDWVKSQNSCNDMGNDHLGSRPVLPLDTQENVSRGKGDCPLAPNLSGERQISNACLHSIARSQVEASVDMALLGIELSANLDHDLSLLWHSDQSVLQGAQTMLASCDQLLTDANTMASTRSPCSEVSELLNAMGAEPTVGESSLLLSSFGDMPSPSPSISNPRFLVDGMPSPQFSDSERQFLLSALEFPLMDSPPSCEVSVSDRMRTPLKHSQKTLVNSFLMH